LLYNRGVPTDDDKSGNHQGQSAQVEAVERKSSP
jgi:hypothetical protein